MVVQLTRRVPENGRDLAKLDVIESEEQENSLDYQLDYSWKSEIYDRRI